MNDFPTSILRTIPTKIYKTNKT